MSWAPRTKPREGDWTHIRCLTRSSHYLTDSETTNPNSLLLQKQVKDQHPVLYVVSEKMFYTFRRVMIHTHRWLTAGLVLQLVFLDAGADERSLPF